MKRIDISLSKEQLNFITHVYENCLRKLPNSTSRLNGKPALSINNRVHTIERVSTILYQLITYSSFITNLTLSDKDVQTYYIKPLLQDIRLRYIELLENGDLTIS